MMERPIGDKFIYDYAEVEVCLNTNDIGSICKGCFFSYDLASCYDSLRHRGKCCNRDDGERVIFKRKGGWIERPIGDKFIYKTVELEVCLNTNTVNSVCKGCFFKNKPVGCLASLRHRGYCCDRNDGELVIFKRVE